MAGSSDIPPQSSADIPGLDTQLAAKAPLLSPALTGTPTAPTATAGTNTTQLATTAYVRGALADLVASAPSTLDTLNELAVALGNDANFAGTVTAALAAKASSASLTTHTSNTSNPHSVTAAQVGAYTTSQVDTALAGKAATSHTHAAADIVSGYLDPARIASGTPTEGQVPTIQSGGSVAWNTPSAGGAGVSNALYLQSNYGGL